MSKLMTHREAERRKFERWLRQNSSAIASKAKRKQARHRQPQQQQLEFWRRRRPESDRT
jgi:hypothetical protein